MYCPKCCVVTAVACAVLALSGCSVLQNLTGSTSNVDFTGNYAFAQAPNSSGRTTGPVTGLLGAIANTGPTFTATFRLVTPNNCASPTQDLDFTGSQSSSGQITLSSTSLAANPITITWDDDPTQSSNGVGTWVISGNGPCATASTQFVSDQFLQVTGTYTGILTSSTGAQATVSANLIQEAANADGQFPEVGMLVLSTPTCTNNFTASGLVTGPTLSVQFNPSSSTSLGGFTAALPDHVLTLGITPGLTVAGSCNGGTYTGSLAKQ